MNIFIVLRPPFVYQHSRHGLDIGSARKVENALIRPYRSNFDLHLVDHKLDRRDYLKLASHGRCDRSASVEYLSWEKPSVHRNGGRGVDHLGLFDDTPQESVAVDLNSRKICDPIGGDIALLDQSLAVKREHRRLVCLAQSPKALERIQIVRIDDQKQPVTDPNFSRKHRVGSAESLILDRKLDLQPTFVTKIADRSVLRPDDQANLAKSRGFEIFDDHFQQSFAAGDGDQSLDAHVSKTLLIGGQSRPVIGTHPRPKSAGEDHCFCR